MQKTIPLKLLLNFIYSLCLCYNIGDTADDIDRVLKLAGIEIEWEELSELIKPLSKLGAHSIWEDDDEDGQQSH